MIYKFRAFGHINNPNKKEMSYKVLIGNTDTDDDNYTANLVWVEKRKEWVNFDEDLKIMQSSGSFDDNGKEVWDGDILFKNGYWDMFVFRKDGNFYCASTDKVQRANWKPQLLSQLLKEGYVTANKNIYENPVFIDGEINI